MLIQRATRLTYAAAFTALFMMIGWQEINPYGFPDLESYRLGFQSRWYLFTTLNLSPIEFALAEGLWIRGFDQLYNAVGNIDTAFTIVSTVTVLLISSFIVARTQSPYYLIFLLNPAFVELALAQIRSGLASGIFWIAVSIKNTPVKIGMLIACCLIHTAFFLYSFLYILYMLINKTEIFGRLRHRPWISVVGLVTLALIITSIRGAVLAFFGDDRAYAFLDYSSGIMLSLAWFSFVLTYILFRQESRISFEALFYIFSSAMYLFSAMNGVYGSRFISIAIPAMAIMCSQLSSQYRPLYTAQFAAFSGAYFFYWLR